MGIFSSFGKILNDVLGYPLGIVLKFFFNFTQNYALLLVLFTVIVRFLLFPLAVKQQRSSAEMLRMKPKMEKIQKKYAKDKEKLQVETQKLYAEEGYNPLSGCLPMLIQLPIFYALYTVVYNPLTYIMWYSQSKIDKIAEILRSDIKIDFNVTNFNDQKIQLYIAKAMGNHMDKLGFLGNAKNVDFNLFGIDMSAQPKLGLTVLVLIPILCYVTQALSSWFNFRMNKAVQQGQPGGASTNMMMIFLMPLMSAWFSLAMPAAVGFYWIITNLFMIVQVIILNKFFSLDKLAAKAEINSDKRKQAIIDGTAKPSRMAQFTQKALEAQKQPVNGASQAKSQISEKSSVNLGKVTEVETPTDTLKVNSKGNKSRSQIKDEQRRKLAQSRNKDI